MNASENHTPPGDSHRVQLRAAYEGTVGDGYGGPPPGGAERLYLMVTAVFDRLTADEETARKAHI